MYEFIFTKADLDRSSKVIIAVIPFCDILSCQGFSYDPRDPGSLTAARLMLRFLPSVSRTYPDHDWAIEAVARNHSTRCIEILFSHEFLPEIFAGAEPRRMSCREINEMFDAYNLIQVPKPISDAEQLPETIDPIPTRKLVLPNGSSPDQIDGDPVPSV